MATLYWGGGTGTWDGFTTGKWYTDVGRTTLSSRAPSAEDDVVFDSASNATAYTVTISNGTAVCKSCTIAGPASGNLTLAGSTAWFIYGNLTLPATGLTRTFTGAINFYGSGSQTITTNGIALASGMTFAGTGTYTLQDALNNGTSAVAIDSGTFDTNGKNLTCGAITGAAGALTLGASTVSATALVGPLTVNAGTSNITLSAGTAGIGSSTGYTGNTFYNVTLSSTAITTSSFYGNNTFNNLTFTAPASARVCNVVLYGNQTVNGTLTIPGQSSVNRYFVRSNVPGTTRTLTVAAVAALTDVDFRDITVAGGSSPWSGTRIGDCGGNTNISGDTPKTVYWNNTTGGAWTGNFWATSSGGAVSTANFPLAQDTVIIDDTGLNVGVAITGGAGYNVKTITSTKTNAYSLRTTPILYGDLSLTASMTIISFGPTFAGRVTQNLTSAGNTIDVVTCNGYNASVKLADNTTVSTWTIVSGGLDTNSKNFTVTTATVSTTNTGAFSLTLGSSAVSIGATSGLGSSSTLAPTMTVSAGTSTITLANGAASFGFEQQTLTWYNVVWSSVTTAPKIYGTNTFNNLTFTALTTATGVSPITIYGNQTISGTLALGGGAAAYIRLGVYSSVPGTQRTITAATVTGLTDIDFRDIKGAGAGTWTGGTRIGDCGGCSGIGFTTASPKYWNLAGSNSWSAIGWATASGGTPAANNFPLPQDTCVFDNVGNAGTITLDAQWNIGTIDASARTTAMTLAGAVNINIYGDVKLGVGVISSAQETWIFQGTTTQTFTTAGSSVANDIVVNNPSCVFRHGDAFLVSASTSSITVDYGSYTTQNYNVTVGRLISNNSNTRSITLGTSTVTLSGSTPIMFTTSTGLTFSGSSATINLSTALIKSFDGGGMTFGTVSSTGGTTSRLTINGNNTFGTLTNSAYTYLVLISGTEQTITTFSYTGASGNVVRWYTDIPGQRATIKQSSTGGSLAAVGANSVDGGNNNGLTFTGTAPDYFYVKDIAYSAYVPPVTGTSSNFFAFF